MKYTLLIFCLILLSCTVSNEPLSIDPPSESQSSLARLVTSSDGIVHMTWVEQKSDTAHLYYSTFDGDNWTSKKELSKSTKWFVNWADFPAIVVQNDLMAVNVLAKVPGNTYSYNVEMSTFEAGEQTSTFLAHDDGTATEHGFVSMQALSDSTFYAVWLDGRNTAGRSHDEYGDMASAMTLRGAEMDIMGNILASDELDATVCDCCNTSLAMTSSGLVAAYRNRTENEIRDIYVSRRVDGEWTEGYAAADDNWEIAACPVNGPQITARGDKVALAWFTGAGNENKVKLAFSDDAGKTFGTPILIDDNKTLGRVDVELSDEGNAIVSWVANRSSAAALVIKEVSPDGETLKEMEITEMSFSRKSGFPQLTSTSSGYLLAWTHIFEDGSNEIRMKTF